MSWRLIVVAMLLVAPGCGKRRALSDDQGVSAADHGVPDAPRVDGTLDARGTDAALPYADRVARACAFVAACAAQLAHDVRASQCVEWFAYRDWPHAGLTGLGPSMLDRLLACAPAASCKAFRSCYGGSWVGPTVCREGSCSGSMLGSYGNSALFLECDKLGATCVDLATGALRACCASKTCSGTSTTTCDPQSSTKGTECLLGVSHDFDCAPVGKVCSESPSLLCQGAGGACDPASTVSCKGSLAQHCMGNADGSGNLATVDCSKTVFRSACNAGGSSDTPCRPAGSACGPSFAGACQGSGLQLCVDGQQVTVDCVGLGFDLCGNAPLTKAPQCMHAL